MILPLSSHLRSPLSKGLTAALLLSILSQFHSKAWADLNSEFAPPAFEPGASIVGKGGWNLIASADAKIYNDPEAAKVTGSPVMSPAQGYTLELKTGIENTAFEKISTPTMVMEAVVAFAFSEKFKWPNVGVKFWFGTKVPGGSPVQFGFDYGPDGGWFYQIRGQEKVVVLSREEIEQHQSYRVQMIYSKGTGDIQFIFRGVGENHFKYESQKVALSGEYDPAFLEKGIYIMNQAPTVIECWIDKVRITGMQ